MLVKVRDNPRLSLTELVATGPWMVIHPGTGISATLLIETNAIPPSRTTVRS